eukprot:UN00854
MLLILSFIVIKIFLCYPNITYFTSPTQIQKKNKKNSNPKTQKKHHIKKIINFHHISSAFHFLLIT